MEYVFYIVNGAITAALLWWCWRNFNADTFRWACAHWVITSLKLSAQSRSLLINELKRSVRLDSLQDGGKSDGNTNKEQGPDGGFRHMSHNVMYTARAAV